MARRWRRDRQDPVEIIREEVTVINSKGSVKRSDTTLIYADPRGDPLYDPSTRTFRGLPAGYIAIRHCRGLEETGDSKETGGSTDGQMSAVLGAPQQGHGDQAANLERGKDDLVLFSSEGRDGITELDGEPGCESPAGRRPVDYTASTDDLGPRAAASGSARIQEVNGSNYGRLDLLSTGLEFDGGGPSPERVRGDWLSRRR